MIIAGLDEAGYGPLLGPLVVGCCAFDLPDCQNIQELPCLWKRLGKMVSKKRSTSGKKIQINDSKVVYSPSDGLRELERGVLAVITAMTEIPVDFQGMVSRVADHALIDLAKYPWYAPPTAERFPLEQEAISIRLMANALRNEMERNQSKCVHLAARIVLERQFNTQVSATRNKASVLFSTAAIHLDYLLRNFGHLPMVIFCDRQGGREHYGSLLRLMFEDWKLEVVQEIEGECDYHLHRNGNAVRLIFREKAEAQCLPVALASMLSKYLREALMGRFNAFWATHLPQLNPTAGYYTDGLRFLRDIEVKRRELAIKDHELIRSR
jgi:ribonuclease HII